MTLSSQDYADLSDRAYKPPVWDKTRNEYEIQTVNGIKYRPLEYMENRSTGYQGTIYQRLDTGEIVVTHRGTEPPTQDLRDALTDAGMVLRRVNAQAPDAEKLTLHALERAKGYAKKYPGEPIPEVTVTGHSLGGSLAEWTASKYGLPGQTFNAYGVAGLTGSTPLTENSPPIINHVMAADPVSAASSHIGQVRMYATEKEDKTIGALYSNHSSLTSRALDAALPPPVKAARAVTAAAASLGSHGIGNFTNEDEQGHPHPSVLNDPQAQQRAAQNARMFQHYRSDVYTARAVLSLPGDAGRVAGQGYDYVSQAVNATRDTMVQGAQAVEKKAEQVSRTVNEGAARAWDTLTTRAGALFGNDKPAQAESAKPSDVRGLSGAGREQSSQDKVKVLTGDPAVDRMLANLNNPAAFRESVNMVANSPQGDAIRAEGRALYDRQQLATQQQERDTEAQRQDYQRPALA